MPSITMGVEEKVAMSSLRNTISDQEINRRVKTTYLREIGRMGRIVFSECLKR